MLQRDVGMNLNAEALERLNNHSSNCVICGTDLGDRNDAVRHHDHFSGYVYGWVLLTYT